MQGFRGALGIKVTQCRPRDPEAKGLVERVNGYFETSFLPGRSFGGPADFNTPIGSSWPTLAGTGDSGPVRSSGGTPTGRRC